MAGDAVGELAQRAGQLRIPYVRELPLDYLQWAEEIARLSLTHSNLTAWVMDDFYANREFFTPAYVRQIQQRAKAVNPQLAFLPLMYYDELQTTFVTDYREVIDGVVVAYLQDREEIEWAWAVLNDAAVSRSGDLIVPPSRWPGTPSASFNRHLPLPGDPSRP